MTRGDVPAALPFRRARAPDPRPRRRLRRLVPALVLPLVAALRPPQVDDL